MPAQANANVIALQLEKVRDKVPLLYERDDILLTMIQQRGDVEKVSSRNMRLPLQVNPGGKAGSYNRSEEHTSELQSPCNLVCRLLLEKKKLNNQSTFAYAPHSSNAHQEDGGLYVHVELRLCIYGWCANAHLEARLVS